MKRKLTAILLLAALCLSVTGCGAAEKPVSDPTAAPSLPVGPTDTAAPSPTAPAETAAPGERAPSVTVQVVEREAETFDSDETVLLDYAAEQPRADVPERPEAAAAINAVLEADYCLFRDGVDDQEGVSGKEAYLTAARERYASLQNDGFADSFAPFVLQSACQVKRADDRVLSIVTDETTYLGGAHGYTGRSARNFDVHTGAVLQLEDLAQDPEAFLELCADLLWTASRGGENALIAAADGYYDGYEESLPGLLRDGNWYFGREGIVVIANPYEIAPYAAGRIELTMPYDQLRWVMKEEFFPPESKAEGEITGEILPWPMEAAYSIDDGTDGQGACVFLTADGDLEDVRLTRVTYWDYNNSFSEESTLWAASDLPAGCTVLLRTWIGDVLPTLKLSYVSAGQNREIYISQSGKDGSLVLLDGKQFLVPPLEITKMLPFAYDVDADSVQEIIDLADGEEEGYLRLTVDGEALGDVFSVDPELLHLWLTDLDFDGRAELLFSADMGSDDYVTSAWRADTLEPIRFSMETRNGRDGSETTDTADGRVLFSCGSLFLESWTYQLGTYDSLRPYELLNGSVIVPWNTEYILGAGDWAFPYNRVYLTLRRELSVTLDDGGTVIPAGTKILLLGTDGTKMRFRIDDGRTGTLLTQYVTGENSGWYIDGVRDSDCFETLPYTG